MSDVTDPARELVEMCENLRTGNSELRGDAFLANRFEVKVWSSEFYQIIFTISGRIDLVEKLTGQLDIADDLKNGIKGNLAQLRQAFMQNGLQNNWRHSLSTYLLPENLHPVKMLSSHFVKTCSYAKLDEQEIAELVEQVDVLAQWLAEHQLAERDFIRQAIIDGLEQFRFRVQRIQWLGWGYTLQSLRDVISAYIALESAAPDVSSEPIAIAILQKTRTAIIAIFEKAKCAREVIDTSDFALRAYGATVLAIQGHQTLSGLLTHVVG